jgi:hypothetical protein
MASQTKMANYMPGLHGQQHRTRDPILKAIVQGGITLEQYDNLYDRYNSRCQSNEYLQKVLCRLVAAIGMTAVLKGVCMSTLTLHILEQLKKDPYSSWPNMHGAKKSDDAWRDALREYCAACRRITMQNVKIHLKKMLQKGFLS